MVKYSGLYSIINLLNAFINRDNGVNTSVRDLPMVKESGLYFIINTVINRDNLVNTSVRDLPNGEVEWFILHY